MNHSKSERVFPAWGTLALGISLLILAVFLGWWGLANWPGKTARETGEIAPVNQIRVIPSSAEAPPTSQSPTPSEPQPTLSPTRQATRKHTNNPVRKGHPTINREPVIVAAPSTPSSIATPSPSPQSLPSTPTNTSKTEVVEALAPTPIVSPSPSPAVNSPKVDRPNVFLRVLRWLFPWFGKKKQTGYENHSPEVVSVTASIPSILRPCPPRATSISCTPTGNEEMLEAKATDPDNDTLLYTWSVTGGRLSGEGHQVTWDLSGVANGTYTATVEVNDGYQHTASRSTAVSVSDCTGCFEPPPPCPTVSVSCPSDVLPDQPITFVTDNSSEVTWTYNWSVSAGVISNGQGTSRIIVDTRGFEGQSVTATVSVGGTEPSCTGTTGSCTTSVKVRPQVLIPINGRVQLADKIVRNGQVVITSSAGQQFSVSTDQSGIFSISLPPGQYSLQVVSPSPSLPVTLQVSSDDANKIFSFNLPDATGTASPSPQPTASLSPTPTPSVTPTPTGTPATEKIIKESERITVELPRWFLKDVNNTVTLDLKRVVGIVERLVTTNPNTNTVTITDNPKASTAILLRP